LANLHRRCSSDDISGISGYIHRGSIVGESFGHLFVFKQCLQSPVGDESISVRWF
jgi:hypothetical protein